MNNAMQKRLLQMPTLIPQDLRQRQLYEKSRIILVIALMFISALFISCGSSTSEKASALLYSKETKIVSSYKKTDDYTSLKKILNKCEKAIDEYGSNAKGIKKEYGSMKFN